MIRRLVFWLMDRACSDWNGHAFVCWNRPRWVSRVWGWAWPTAKEERIRELTSKRYPTGAEYYELKELLRDRP